MKKLLAALRKLFGQSSGFTLIELLVVIAIIGILAGALFVAINPGARIKQANVAAAQNAVVGYSNKIEAYAADPSTNGGQGVYPGGTDPSGAVGAAPTTGNYAYGYQAWTSSNNTNCDGTASTGTCAKFSFWVDLSTSNPQQRYIYDSNKGSTCTVSNNTGKTC